MKSKTVLKQSYLWLLILISGCGIASATNITIYDGRSSNETGWKGKQEDNEVEPPDQIGQRWDHEAFFYSGSSLSILSGYDFVNGVYGLGQWESGDIFIDLDGDYDNDGFGQSINDNVAVNDDFGYEYVVSLGLKNGVPDHDYGGGAYGGSYRVYDLRSTSGATPWLETSYFIANDASNPWAYDRGGVEILSAAGNFSVSRLTGDPTVTVEGEAFYGSKAKNNNVYNGTHYLLEGVDFSFLNGDEFWVHNTMQCGNDNIIGHYPVPEPASLILIGVSIMGLGVYKRCKKT